MMSDLCIMVSLLIPVPRVLFPNILTIFILNKKKFFEPFLERSLTY